MHYPLSTARRGGKFTRVGGGEEPHLIPAKSCVNSITNLYLNTIDLFEGYITQGHNKLSSFGSIVANDVCVQQNSVLKLIQNRLDLR